MEHGAPVKLLHPFLWFASALISLQVFPISVTSVTHVFTDQLTIIICIPDLNLKYLLQARTVEPEKQPLLANGSETTFVSRQRLGKHVPVAADTYATIDVLLETLFSTRSMQRGYKEDNRVESNMYSKPPL
jgi:hypothetical protein